MRITRSITCGAAALLTAFLSAFAVAPDATPAAPLPDSATCGGCTGHKSIEGAPSQAGLLRIQDTTRIRKGECEWKDKGEGVLSCEKKKGCKLTGRITITALSGPLFNIHPTWEDVSTGTQQKIRISFDNNTFATCGQLLDYTFDYFDFDQFGNPVQKTFHLKLDCKKCKVSIQQTGTQTGTGTPGQN